MISYALAREDLSAYNAKLSKHLNRNKISVELWEPDDLRYDSVGTVIIGNISAKRVKSETSGEFLYFREGLNYLPLVGWTTVGELVKGV